MDVQKLHSMTKFMLTIPTSSVRPLNGRFFAALPLPTKPLQPMNDLQNFGIRLGGLIYKMNKPRSIRICSSACRTGTSGHQDLL